MRWTKTDIRRLRDLIKTLDLREISKRLGRTYDSVRVKAYDIGLKGR